MKSEGDESAVAGDDTTKIAVNGMRGGQDDWAYQFVETFSEILVCICHDGLIDYVNPAGMRLLGIDGDAKGLAIGEYIHEVYRQDLAKYLSGDTSTQSALRIKMMHRGVVELDVDFSALALEGTDNAVIIQARDVTGLIRSAEETRESEERYRHLFENAHDMIAVCDNDRIHLINRSGAKILGEDSPDALVGRHLDQVIHPDYHEIIADGLGVFVGESTAIPLKFQRSDGEILDVEVAVMPFGGDHSGQYMMEVRDITERVRAAETLRQREMRLRGIMDTVADAIITIDESGIIQSFNKAAERIFDYEAREVIGANVKILTGGYHSGNHDQYLANYLNTGVKKIIGVRGREETGRRKDGSEFPIELAVTELRQGKNRIFTGIVRDITERKKAEEALHKAHEELEMRVEERTRELTQEIAERQKAEEQLHLAAEVIENLTEAVVIIDSTFKVASVNPAFTAITGYARSEVVGHYPPNHAALSREGVLFATMWEALEGDGRWDGEFWNTRKNGEEYAEHLSVSAIKGVDGHVHQFAAVISDITKRKQDEERILYQANYDALTGLPNRALFQDRLTQSLANMERAGKNLGLMFIDLDGFKLVNDTLGHDTGDLLLQEAAKRLGTCVRTGDTVARLGGDEFTIIMPNLNDPQHAPVVAQRVLDSMSKPFHLGGHEAFVSGSIGITIFPDDARDAQELLKNADAAMYRAKERGKANYQFFTADLNDEVKERMSIKNGLGKALENEEFQLYYQPKLDLKSNRITTVEALMRWDSPDVGFVSPARFIPVLEETGMVVEVGAWAIRKACEQHMQWIEEGLDPIRIAVNLSARQLRDDDFVPLVKQVIEDTQVPVDALEIEITESMLMSDAKNVVIALKQLNDMGIHISMDDFGTGYSSLSYLKKFPIDTIKIDRSFVADIATNLDDAEIIRTIITMGQTLNRRVIAEGVEDEEQFNILLEYNCDEIQGYFISRPLPDDQLGDFVRQWHDQVDRSEMM